MNNVFFSASAQHHGQTVSEKQWDSVCFWGFLLSCSCVSASLSQKSSFTLQRLVRSSFEQAACQHDTLTFTRTCKAQRYSLVTEWKNTFFFCVPPASQCHMRRQCIQTNSKHETKLYLFTRQWAFFFTIHSNYINSD